MAVDWDTMTNWSSPPRSVLLKLIEEERHHDFDNLTQNVLAVFKGAGHLFYIVNPADSTYRTPEEVPKIFRQAWPYFLLFILLENAILWLEKKPTPRLNDTITSLSHGLIHELGRLLFRGAESYLYVYIYEHFRLVELPWDSAWTWYAAALGVDFCYYWVHRASHEVHILWAQHQVHHSSEEFNLAVGLRQSMLHGWCGFVFYLPLALLIPPAHFLTHQQFNLLFQFWIHTKAVQTLGPLEWIFNTPNHHRVHHGSNIYCLDKNFGGVLIVWDRLFGTFAEEQKKEEIIYGLVYNQPSFNPFYLQTFYTAYVVEKVKSMSDWKHKFAAIFYGPSWMPGTPRLGREEDKIDVRGREIYNVSIPTWCNMYLLLHFIVVVFGFQELAARHLGMNPVTVLGFVLYFLLSLSTIGMLFDNKPYACAFELTRCLALVFLLQHKPDLALLPSSVSLNVLQTFFLVSGLFWGLQTFKILEVCIKKKT